MIFDGLVKSLVLPAGFDPPTELVHDDLRATVLGRADLDADVRGINDSLELIRRTRGGGWPTEAVTEEFDFVDLVWHECEFREGYSFSYAVYDDGRRLRGLLLPLSDGQAHAALRATPRPRRRRELVGHTGGLRTRPLRDVVPSVAALGRGSRSRSSTPTTPTATSRPDGCDPADTMGVGTAGSRRGLRQHGRRCRSASPGSADGRPLRVGRRGDTGRRLLRRPARPRRGGRRRRQRRAGGAGRAHRGGLGRRAGRRPPPRGHLQHRPLP